MGMCRGLPSDVRRGNMAFAIPIKITAPDLVAAINRLGSKMTELSDQLVAAQARSHDDADAVVAAFTKLGQTIERLREALANQPDDEALRNVLADMDTEHAALAAALAGVPSDPPVIVSDPTGGTGEASV